MIKKIYLVIGFINLNSKNILGAFSTEWQAKKNIPSKNQTKYSYFEVKELTLDQKLLVQGD